MKKTAIAAALLAATSTAQADVLVMDWTGVFTMLNPSGGALLNSDFATNSTNGYRTEITGQMTFDTFTGSGSTTVDPFQFFGGGPAVAHDITMQAIGNGGTGVDAGPGTLVAGAMLFDWNGTTNITVDLVLDAGGFFTSGIVDAAGNLTGAFGVGDSVIAGPGAVLPTVETNGGICVNTFSSFCLTALDDPAAGNTSWTLPGDPVPGTLYTDAGGAFATVVDGGPQLMSTIDGNPFVTENVTITQPGVDGILGTADDVTFTGNRHSDGIGGIRMDNGPFPGFSANFDVRTMTIVSATSAVPVPAAVWLFGSGLLGLVGVARRRAA